MRAGRRNGCRTQWKGQAAGGAHKHLQPVEDGCSVPSVLLTNQPWTWVLRVQATSGTLRGRGVLLRHSTSSTAQEKRHWLPVLLERRLSAEDVTLASQQKGKLCRANCASAGAATQEWLSAPMYPMVTVQGLDRERSICFRDRRSIELLSCRSRFPKGESAGDLGEAGGCCFQMVLVKPLATHRPWRL